MKILNIICAITLFNLFAVVVISNLGSVSNFNSSEQVYESYVTPTPNVIVKQVVKKVTRFAKDGQTSSTKSSTVTSSTPSTMVAQPTQAPVDNRCIITLDGARYDVSALRNSHSGGDVFSCGTDMSATFWSKHGQSIFNRMQQYRI